MQTFSIGQRAAMTRVFREEDVLEYASLVGDPSPIARRHVPGPLIGGMFSRLLGTSLPGRGTNWLKQSLCFHAPVRVGEEVTAIVEIVRLRPDKNLIDLRTACIDASGALLCDGRALVMAREMDQRAVVAQQRYLR